MTQTPIENGQRYQEAATGYLGRPAAVWVVETTFTKAADGLLYAQLAREGDKSMRKTLAADVLADRRRFSRIEPG